MATPVGNPQNLYLYAFYGLNGAQFFRALLPLVLVSLLGLTAACLCTGKRELRVDFPRPVSLRSPGRLAVYLALFGFCLLSVFRLVPYAAVTAGVLAVFLVLDRKLLQRVDYGLLLTFLCFFVFSGNLGRIAPVRDFLSELLTRGSLLCSVAASQIISNVPAAVLLSGFTDDWRGLLAGVNIGGLGTPIASLGQPDFLPDLSAAAGGEAGKISADLYSGESGGAGRSPSDCSAAVNGNRTAPFLPFLPPLAFSHKGYCGFF